jgi:hypothetical protein
LCRGQLHSVFHRTANIEVSGSLYALYSTGESSSSGSSWRAAGVHDLDFLQGGFEAGQECCFGADGVWVGEVFVDTSKASVWKPRLERGCRTLPPPLTVHYFLTLLAMMSPKAGIHPSVDRELVRALGYPEQAAENARRLIGLGPGLTPAGDDLVLGALATANHLVSSPALASALAKTVQARVAYTTDISAQMLRDALQGEYHEILDDMIFTLAGDDLTAIAAALDRLVHVGASSGSDMAAGIAAVLRSLQSQDELPLHEMRCVQC